jgi:hypothetical protein
MPLFIFGNGLVITQAGVRLLTVQAENQQAGRKRYYASRQ